MRCCRLPCAVGFVIHRRHRSTCLFSLWDIALNAANRYRHVLYGIPVALYGVSIAVVKGYHRYQQSNELRHRHRHNNYRVHFCV